MSDTGISRVTMVKSDAEGNDYKILVGAVNLLLEGRIELWQFEYNHRWLAANSSLRNVFELVAEAPYRVGRLFGNGIELYEHWHPELDRFFETQYLLVRTDSDVINLAREASFSPSNTAMLR